MSSLLVSPAASTSKSSQAVSLAVNPVHRAILSHHPGTASLTLLLICLFFSNFVSATIMINAGALGESFYNKSFDVTSALRGSGVTNANGRPVSLDFVFGDSKALRVNGDGTALTATLETDWVTNPSGIGRGYSLSFGSASLVSWLYEGSGLFGDSSPVVDTSPPLSRPPGFFNVLGSVPTAAFPSYFVDIDGLSLGFRLPSSSNLGFPATVPEEQLVLRSARLSFASEGRPTGVPGLEAFSEYTVVSSVSEPATWSLTLLTLLLVRRFGKRRIR